MIFGQEMIDAVLAGRKTVTRRPVKFLDGPTRDWLRVPCRYKPGRTYAVQPRIEEGRAKVGAASQWAGSRFGASTWKPPRTLGLYPASPPHRVRATRARGSESGGEVSGPGQMHLAPAPDPRCTRNLATWRNQDGTQGQLCCCDECTQVRREALELSRASSSTSKGA